MCYNALKEQRDVNDVIVVNDKFNPIRSTMEEQVSLQYSGMYGQLIDRCRLIINEMDEEDELDYLRVRTIKHEVLVTPDEKLTFIVLQSPKAIYDD